MCWYAMHDERVGVRDDTSRAFGHLLHWLEQRGAWTRNATAQRPGEDTGVAPAQLTIGHDVIVPTHGPTGSWTVQRCYANGRPAQEAGEHKGGGVAGALLSAFARRIVLIPAVAVGRTYFRPVGEGFARVMTLVLAASYVVPMLAFDGLAAS